MRVRVTVRGRIGLGLVVRCRYTVRVRVKKGIGCNRVRVSYRVSSG